MTSFEPPPHQGAAPGWYPVDPDTQRYWDGYQWTNHVAALYRGPYGAVAPIPSTPDERLYAMLMHLGGLFGGIIVPLVMWLIKRRESWFVDYHGRQALNLHLSMMLYLLCAFFTIVFLIGILALPAVVICFIGYSIAATQAAHRGQLIRCPLSIRFLLEPRPQNW